MRRYGDSLRPGIRYRARPGVYAILPRGAEVLVTFQATPFAEFQLPGGGIDPGEQPIAALHREVYEETGWRIAAPRCIGVYRRYAYMPEYDLWAEKICHVWLARPLIQAGPPTEPGHTAVFLPVSEAADRVASAGDRDLLRRLFA